MATIYDVARESGFSLSTVSNILNNGPKPVRPETRRKVLEVMERLNYHPNAVARGLARQKTHTIGIMFGVVESSEIVINAYSAAILQAVLAVAGETGYDVTHVTTPWRGADESLSHFRDGRTDGLLVIAPPTDSDLIPALSSLGMPLVAVSWPQGRGEVLSVDVDDVAGARVAMDHLLGLGHRRIAHLTGHRNLVSAETRRQVYMEKMAAAGIDWPSEYLRPGYYSVESGYQTSLPLLRLPSRPTAVFAGNDEIAMGVLQAARELGLRVPEDLSVIGVDDRPFSELTHPPLTTMHQPFDEVGREATRLLVRRLKGEQVPLATHLFSPRLVVRQSTAPPSPGG